MSPSFTGKQEDKLFWDENVGHIKISHKPAKTRYAQVRIAVIIKSFCWGQMQVNAFMNLKVEQRIDGVALSGRRLRLDQSHRCWEAGQGPEHLYSQTPIWCHCKQQPSSWRQTPRRRFNA